MKNFLLQFLSKEGLSGNKELPFDQIVGHNEIKMILNKAVFSKNPVHVLLAGPPGSAKTTFLLEINRFFRQSLFVVGSNTTKAGLVDRLFELKPKTVLVDELEKMNHSDQVSLLHLMETGIISETKVRRSREIQLHSSVFATANNFKKIAAPLLSRFVVLKIPPYTYDEFKKIVVSRLKREKIDEKMAVSIAERVWNDLCSKDVRDAIKIARLCKNTEVSSIIRIMKTYGART